MKKHESCYASTDIITSTRFGNIEYMQALAYDYYFYCKRNYLMADRTFNMVVFLEPYLEAILCTYGPEKNVDKTNPLTNLFSMYQPERQFPISEIDLDMFVKHTNPETLLGWLSKYKVDTIIYEEGIDVSEKYSNLCAHLKTYSQPGSVDYLKDMDWLKSFSILLIKSRLSSEKTDAIIKAVSNLLEVDFTNIHHAYLRPILSVLSGLITTHPSEKWNSVLKILIELDKIPKSRKMITDYCYAEYFRCLDSLFRYADLEIKLKIENFLDSVDNCSDKCNCLFLFAKYVEWAKWSPYLLENLQDLKVNKLCYLVEMDYIPMDGRVMERFIQEIQKEICYRKKFTGSRHLDPIQQSITECIYLHIKKGLDITQLTPYCEYSAALSFLLDPDRFDYTKVNTRDPEWDLIFSNEKYALQLKKHKSEILSEKLRTEYRKGLFSLEQYRIVFGILLDQEELWTFGYE